MSILLGNTPVPNAPKKLMFYPGDIHDQKFHTRIGIYKYRRWRPTNPPRRTPIAEIFLPLPIKNIDASHLNVGPENLGMLGNAAQAYNNSTITSGNGISSLMASFSGDKATTIAALTVGGAAGTLSDLILGNLGRILGVTNVAPIVRSNVGALFNPRTTALFTGVQLKNNQLSWTFAPKNSMDSIGLNNIINILRQAAHPTYSVGEFILDYPDEIEISFIGADYFMIDIAPSLISTVVVDNTPTGYPAMYDDGSPVIRELSISLTEIQIRTDRDFGRSPLGFANDRRVSDDQLLRRAAEEDAAAAGPAFR